MTAQALFETTANGYRATELSRGPWDPRACHGGPVAALVGHVFGGHAQSEAFAISRVTLELLRPVPLGELEVEVVERRPGRKVQLLDLHMRSAGTEVATARALRIRREEIEIPDAARGAAASMTPPRPPDEGRSSQRFDSNRQAFHSHGAEIRMIEGTFEGQGPGTAWIRLRYPVVEGADVSPIERVLAASDFSNGISSLLSFEDYVFINPDLSVYLTRYPVGEWVCLEASTTLSDEGAGLAQSALWDEQGPIGHATQGLIVDKR